MHVINITMNPLVQLIYTNKNFLKIKWKQDLTVLSISKWRGEV
jgi:hypothetical protein